MTMLVGIGAIIAAALFTGAAGYISLVEHATRLGLDDAPLLAQWKASYARALPLQSGLAVVGGCLGLIAWYLARDWRWAAGSMAILANWPFTLLAIKPTNDRLYTVDAGCESRDLLLLWGRRHAARSILGVVATLLFMLAIVAA